MVMKSFSAYIISIHNLFLADINNSLKKSLDFLALSKKKKEQRAAGTKKSNKKRKKKKRTQTENMNSNILILVNTTIVYIFLETICQWVLYFIFYLSKKIFSITILSMINCCIAARLRFELFLYLALNI